MSAIIQSPNCNSVANDYVRRQSNKSVAIPRVSLKSFAVVEPKTTVSKAWHGANLELRMFEVQFKDDGMAHTLDAEDVCENHGSQTGHHTRTHASGWTISGAVKEDWFYWVNEFEAYHPDFGRVWGDFEDAVFADTEYGYEAFCAVHPVNRWDYQDI